MTYKQIADSQKGSPSPFRVNDIKAMEIYISESIL